jgi:hypothetical protein
MYQPWNSERADVVTKAAGDLSHLMIGEFSEAVVALNLQRTPTLPPQCSHSASALANINASQMGTFGSFAMS